MRRGGIVKEPKDGEIDKLKRRVKRLEKENKRLKSELNTYDSVFKVTSKFLKDTTEEFTLEKLIDAAKKGMGLKEIADDDTTKCPECGNSMTKIKTAFGEIHLCNACNHRKVLKI